jgi:UrcA family protein
MYSIIRSKFHAAIYCLVGTAALSGLSISADATEQNPPTRTVKFADLNIQSVEGAKVLYHRIRVAAREVCEPVGRGDPILREAVPGCIDTAIDNAVKKVNAPLLTALRFGSGSNVRLASK